MAEAIGIITIPVKVLTPVVAVVAAVNGVVPEEVFPIIKVVVFAVSNSRERTNNFSIQNFFIGRGGGSGGDSFRDNDDRGKFHLKKSYFYNARFLFSGGSYQGSRGGSYHSNRDGAYRGASRGNGGSSNYSPY